MDSDTPLEHFPTFEAELPFEVYGKLTAEELERAKRMAVRDKEFSCMKDLVINLHNNMVVQRALSRRAIAIGTALTFLWLIIMGGLQFWKAIH